MISMWIEERQLKKVKAFGKTKSLKYAQVIRMAIAEFLERQGKKAK